jgi:hypothetical protein
MVINLVSLVRINVPPASVTEIGFGIIWFSLKRVLFSEQENIPIPIKERSRTKERIFGIFIKGEGFLGLNHYKLN